MERDAAGNGGDGVTGMSILGLQTKARNGRSYLEADVAEDGYTAHIAIDLTAVFYLMSNASTTKQGRTKRGPLTITRARKAIREALP